MKPENLKVGKFYRIDHTKMGVVYARYDGVEDRHGDEFLNVSLLTATGSGQERLADAVIYLSANGEDVHKRPILWQPRALRPQHITSITAPSGAVQTEWQDKATAAEAQYAEMREKYLEMVGEWRGEVGGPSLAQTRPAYQRLEEIPTDTPPRSFDRRILFAIPALGVAATVVAKLADLF